MREITPPLPPLPPPTGSSWRRRCFTSLRVQTMRPSPLWRQRRPRRRRLHDECCRRPHRALIPPGSLGPVTAWPMGGMLLQGCAWGRRRQCQMHLRPMPPPLIHLIGISSPLIRPLKRHQQRSCEHTSSPKASHRPPPPPSCCAYSHPHPPHLTPQLLLHLCLCTPRLRAPSPPRMAPTWPLLPSCLRLHSVSSPPTGWPQAVGCPHCCWRCTTTA